MLWPIVVVDSAKNRVDSCGRPVLDSPYIFSIHIEEKSQQEKSQPGVRFDFLIEGLKTSHYFQLAFCSGKFFSIDGLIIRREQCISYSSHYSSLCDALLGRPVFSVVPIAKGDVPALSGSTVTQKVSLSVHLYTDAVVISFDDFNTANRFRLADEIEVAVAENGALAALIFHNQLSDYVRAKITGGNL